MTSSSDAMRIHRAVRAAVRRGPLPDCFHGGRPVVNHDLADGARAMAELRARRGRRRFPRLRAIPMRLRGTVIGALNLFRTDRGSLSDDDVTVAQALADVATIAILQNRTSVMAAEVNAQLTRR